MGGESVLFNFGDPNLTIFTSTTGGLGARQSVTLPIANGDPLASIYSNNDLLGDTFTLEVLTGDGVLLRGFFLGDNIDGERVEGAGFQFLGSFDVAAIPEPSTLTLLAIGTFGLFGYGWRRKRKRAA
jgi:hypothetical protein